MEWLVSRDGIDTVYPMAFGPHTELGVSCVLVDPLLFVMETSHSVVTLERQIVQVNPNAGDDNFIIN